jgi:ribosome-associated protein
MEFMAELKKKTAKKAAPKTKTVKKAASAAKAKPVARVPAKKAAVKKAPSAKAKPVAPARVDVPAVLCKAVSFLDEKKAENIVVLDLRPLANYSDFFVVATAANAPHLKALSDGLQRLCKNEQYEGFRAAGTGESGWIIVDYSGVMIHVFSFEMRNLYDLEKLWKDAPRLDLAAIDPVH